MIGLTLGNLFLTPSFPSNIITHKILVEGEGATEIAAATNTKNDFDNEEDATTCLSGTSRIKGTEFPL